MSRQQQTYTKLQQYTAFAGAVTTVKTALPILKAIACENFNDSITAPSKGCQTTLLRFCQFLKARKHHLNEFGLQTVTQKVQNSHLDSLHKQRKRPKVGPGTSLQEVPCTCTQGRCMQCWCLKRRHATSDPLHLATAHAPKICLLRIQDVPHLEVLPYAQPAVPTKVD